MVHHSHYGIGQKILLSSNQSTAPLNIHLDPFPAFLVTILVVLTVSVSALSEKIGELWCVVESDDNSITNRQTDRETDNQTFLEK